MREFRLRTYHKLMLVILVIILVFSLSFSLYLSALMARQMASANQNAKPVGAAKPHIFVQVSSIDSSFRDAFMIGAKRAADQYGIELEIADTLGESGAESYAMLLDAAVDARVDGIILQPAWRESLTKPVNRAIDKQIPFITIEEDLPTSNRNCYVGINSFEFGNMAARLAYEAGGNQAKIAVVYRGLNKENDTESSLKLTGLNDIVSKYEGMKVVRIEQGTNSFFGAEDTFRDILTANPEVNVLICMTARDTVAAAQTVLDLNRLQYVQIIGTDITPEIQNLLDKRVIYGTIIRNPDAIGFQSVWAMNQILQKKPISDFIDVGLQKIIGGQ